MQVFTYTYKNGRKDNQDSFYWSSWSDGSTVLAVADGVGSLDKGAYCSRSTLELVKKMSPDFVGFGVELQALSKEMSALGCGSTLDMIHIRSNRSYTIHHLGDSRVYWVYLDRVEKVTTDHSALAEMVGRGEKITPETVKKYGNLITRGIGCDPYVHGDVLEGSIPSEAVGVLLCTDGLWKGLSPDVEIELSLGWLELLGVRSIHKGTQDNLTGVLGVF